MANAITQIEGGFITVALTNAAVPQYGRIKLNSSGLWSAAGIAEVGQAVLQVDGPANSTQLRAKLFKSEGTQIGVASEAIAVGDPVYTVASAKVSKTATSATLLGTAKTAAAGVDTVFEYIPV